MKHITLTFVIGLFFTFATFAQAAISPDIERKSTKLLDSGNAQAAYDLLKNQKKSGPQDWFLFGMAAHRAGKLNEAETAYRRVLQLDPSSQRAKLELGTVLSNKGQWKESRRLLLDVKASNPPGRVVQNIDRYLAIIEERIGEHAGWRVRASAGVMYDSNVNNATTAKTVTMFGLPFSLSKDAKAQSDMAYILSADFDHILKVSDTVDWQSNFSFNWTDYFKLDEFDSLYLSASTGPVFKLDEKTILSLPFTTSLVSYVNNGGAYSASFGVAPQVRHQVSDKVAVNLAGNINWKHFIDNDARNTWSYSASPSVDIATCGQGTFRFGGALGRESSGIDIYSNDNWALNTSLFCPLGTNMAMTVYASYGESEYDAREAAYTVERHDKRTVVGGTMQYAHKPTGFDGILNVSYTHNGSNLTLYGYDKVQVTGTLRKKF